MSDLQIESIIKFGMLVLGAATPITVGLVKYFNVQKEKIAQNAYGSKKVAELDEVTKSLMRAVEELRGMIGNQTKRFDEFIEKMIENVIRKL